MTLTDVSTNLSGSHLQSQLICVTSVDTISTPVVHVNVISVTALTTTNGSYWKAGLLT